MEIPQEVSYLEEAYQYAYAITPYTLNVWNSNFKFLTLALFSQSPFLQSECQGQCALNKQYLHCICIKKQTPALKHSVVGNQMTFCVMYAKHQR